MSTRRTDERKGDRDVGRLGRRGFSWEMETDWKGRCEDVDVFVMAGLDRRGVGVGFQRCSLVASFGEIEI